MTAMTEPYGVTDTFVTGIGRVEEVAPNLFRVIFCADGKAAYDGTPERVVVDKLIITDAMAVMARQLAAGAGSEILKAEGRGDQAVN